MRTVTVHEAKTHLSRLLREVETGETLIVARGGKPVAQLVPYHTGQRQFDTLPGLVVHMDATFDEALDDFAPYMVSQGPT